MASTSIIRTRACATTIATALVCFGCATLLRAQSPAPGADISVVTAEERRHVVENIRKLLAEKYVFPDVGQKTGEHIVAELERGAFDKYTDAKEFATALTASLQSVTRDKHMRVHVNMPPKGAVEPADPITRHLLQQQSVRQQNFGFRAVKRLEGNVGYLDLDGFAPLMRAQETAIAAMRMLAGSDALVIDLRRNGGGNPDMVRFICSYLFDKPTHINSLYWRQGDRTEEYHTTTDVPGERMGDVPVFVVTSAKTFSAAEEFTYNLQTQKRATIVGETTGGGANPGGVFGAGKRFGIFVPTGRAINPITKTNWEGTGVKPDVAVGADEALDRALELARSAADDRRARTAEHRSARRAQLASDLARAASLFEQKKQREAAGAVDAALAAAREAKLVDEETINWLGYDYLGRKELSMAIAVFEYNTRAFPASANTYDSLGEALMNAGDTKTAIANYRRSLELDPGNDNATAMIEKMEHAGHGHDHHHDH